MSVQRKITNLSPGEYQPCGQAEFIAAEQGVYSSRGLVGILLQPEQGGKPALFCFRTRDRALTALDDFRRIIDMAWPAGEDR